jgi:LPS-assembly protein
MLRRSVLVIALAAALLAPAGGARAQNESPPVDTPEEAGAPAGDEVQVSAAHLERQAGQRLVVGEGAVEIRQRGMRLAADRVVYHEDSKDVIADGNVVLDLGKDRLQGEHLEFNIETRVGFIEHAQGFVQTYYITGGRIDKTGPDEYFIPAGSFTTCEGQLPDWSFHATSTTITIDEYLYTWNPALFVKRLPIFYLPYMVFPIKRERATGMLIPELKYTSLDGFTIRNQFYWAPRDDFDATIGLDYLSRTGWGGIGQLRYLLGPRTHGEVNALIVRDVHTGSRRWSLSSQNSHELPLGIHGEADIFVQSDRQFIASYGDTLEQRSNERTASSFYLSRSWSAYDFALSGRDEVSLVTETRTTLTRFPELTIDRTSTRVLDTDLFLRVSASGVSLKRTDPKTELATNRFHVSPELTWPISLGGVVSLLPVVGYDLTHYTEDTEGNALTRSMGYYRLGLEGPRFYRVWELPGGGATEKVKHLIEPRITYLFTPAVDQSKIIQFDSIDTIAPANRFEYSITNTVFGKRRVGAVSAPAAVREAGGAYAIAPMPTYLTADPIMFPPESPESLEPPVSPDAPAGTSAGPAAEGGAEGKAAQPSFTTQELFWFKLSQIYALDEKEIAAMGHAFSPIEWEARTRPIPSIDLWWKGNYDIYQRYVGYQSLALTWRPIDLATLQGEYRSARGSNQDFLDIGATLGVARFSVEGRSRYNLADKTFVENRLFVKYSSQCWDVAVGYVKWTTDFQYTLQFSLKGIGTIVKI